MEVWVYDNARAQCEQSPDFNSRHVRKEERMERGSVQGKEGREERGKQKREQKERKAKRRGTDGA